MHHGEQQKEKENNKIEGAPWGATKGDRAVKWASQ